MLYAITLFALIVSPLVSAQRCYVAMPDFSGSSNCTAPPFYTRVDIATASTCEHSYCQNVTRNGLQGESGGKSVPTVEEIPKPVRYIELTHNALTSNEWSTMLLQPVVWKQVTI